MSKRIGIIGANGQVAAEVCLILRQIGCDVVPICRGPRGSSFLRYMGVAVRHGSVDDAVVAERLLHDVDVVANFALASGTPAEMRLTHDRLIENSMRFSPSHAPVIFFSTLAANAEFVPEGGHQQRSPYGREKLRNEEFLKKRAEALGRQAIALRLGHVCGEHQGITHMIRSLIAAGPIMVPDPARHANAIATATIADAIAGVAEDRVLPKGRLDLVNTPRWSWETLLAYEAGRAGAALSLEAAAPRSPPSKGNPIQTLARGTARRIFSSPAIKNHSARLLSLLPESQNETIRSRYFAQRASVEIAGLATAPREEIAAAKVPGMDTRVPEGLADTATLLTDPRYVAPLAPIAPSWPDDI